VSPTVPPAAAAAGQQAEDPGGATAAIDRYRELAKYVVTIFAAIGALLAAGTQVSSLGKLSWDDDADRLIAAAIALAFAIGSVGMIVKKALDVLKPVEVSFTEVLGDGKLVTRLVSGPGSPQTRQDLEDLRDLLGSETLTDEEREDAQKEVTGILNRVAFLKTKDAFGDAWKWTLGFGVIGAAAIAVFSWAANPGAGESDSPDVVVKPSPVALTFSLSSAGQEKLRDSLGKECVKNPISALSIGGREGAPVVVVLPRGGCNPQQFTLTSTLSVPISTKGAPSK
jgi:hypothetical protein